MNRMRNTGMSATMNPTVTIRPVEGTCDLLKVYPWQQHPQPCFVALNLRSGDLWADYNPETGGAVPSDVYRGIVLRWPLPLLRADTANALLAELALLAQRILDRPGTPEGVRAQDAIQRRCGAEDDDLFWADAGDWCAAARNDLIARLAAGEDPGALAEELDGDGSDEDRPVLIGLTEYLDRLAGEDVSWRTLSLASD